MKNTQPELNRTRTRRPRVMAVQHERAVHATGTESAAHSKGRSSSSLALPLAILYTVLSSRCPNSDCAFCLECGKVPGLAEAAAEAGKSPLEYMRDVGSFAVPGDMVTPYERIVGPEITSGCHKDDDQVFRKPKTSGTWDGIPEQYHRKGQGGGTR